MSHTTMARINLPPPEQSCGICSKLCVLESIKCDTCNKYIHPNCSKLPAYALVNWFTTRYKYKCEPCVRISMDDEEYDQKYAFVSNLLINDSGNESNGDHEDSVCEQSSQAKSTATSDNLQNDIVIENDIIREQERGDYEQPRKLTSPGPNKPNSRDSLALLPTTTTSNTNNTESSVRNSNKKTQICRFYKTHSCKYGRSGNKCNYAHPKVCYKYRTYGRDTKRGCTSQICTHYHPTICKNSEKDRLCLHLECPYLHLKGTQRYQPESPTSPTSYTSTSKPSRPYPHTNHHQPTNQYHRNDDLQQKNLHFLYTDIQEMKYQLAQVMRLLPIQRDQNHQHHPVPLPNMTHPPPFLH